MSVLDSDRGLFEEEVVELAFLVGCSCELASLFADADVDIASAGCTYGAASILVEDETAMNFICNYAASIFWQISRDEREAGTRKDGFVGSD